MKKATSYAVTTLLPRIVALILLTYFGFCQVGTVFTFVVTAAKLYGITSNIEYIEETARLSSWTDELKEKYDKEINKRKALVNDDNSDIAEFVSANNAKRFGLFMLNLALALVLLYSAAMLFFQTIRAFKRLKKLLD